VSYDPRPTDLWVAIEAFDNAARLIGIGIKYRARAGLETDERYRKALEAVEADRAATKLERNILEKLRESRGETDDEGW
jgi:hypothetical protein